jgi:hypothetical protein
MIVSMRQHTDCWRSVFRKPADCQQQLVLIRLQAGRLVRFITETQVFTDVVSEFRERTITGIRKSLNP